MTKYRRLKQMIDAGWTVEVNDRNHYNNLYLNFTHGDSRAQIMAKTDIATKLLAYASKRNAVK